MEEEEETRVLEVIRGVTLAPKEALPSLEEVVEVHPLRPQWTPLVTRPINSSTTPTCSRRLSTTPRTRCSYSNTTTRGLLDMGHPLDNLHLAAPSLLDRDNREDQLLRSISNLINILDMDILNNKDIRSRLQSNSIMEENLN